MLKGKTASGFEFSVNENIKDDWRFIKAAAKAASGDDAKSLAGYTEIVNIVLGENGEKALSEHLADETGFVSFEAVNNEVQEILGLVNTSAETKNS